MTNSKAFVLFIFVLIIQVSVAQNSLQLSLEDAILKQRTELGPERMNGLIWLNNESIVYQEEKGDEKVLSQRSINSSELKELISLAGFNQLMKVYNEELKAFPRFSQAGQDQLLFQVKGRYFLYEVAKSEVLEFNNPIEGSSDFHLSPDAQYLAYVKDYNLHLAKLGGDQKKITTDGNLDLVYGKAVSRYEFGISKGVFWSPNSEQFAYYINDQSEVSSYPLVDLKTTPASEASIKYPMAGGPSEHISLGIYNVKSGKKVVIKTEEGEEYICSVNWSPDGRQVLLVTLNRDQNHAVYKLYNAENGDFEGNLYEEKDDKYVEPLFPVYFPEKTASRFIYCSQKDGYYHLYSRLNGKEIQLTKGNWEVKEVLGMDDKRQYAYILGTTENPTNRALYKVDLQKGGQNLITKDKGTHYFTSNANNTHFIDHYSSIEIPGEVRLIDGNGKVLKKLLVSKDPLKDHQLNRPELIEIDGANGMKFHARVIKPSSFDPKKKYPALVYVYNGPHAQLVRNTWWGAAPLWMSYFAEKGWIVFTVDGRGSDNRGKEFEQAIFRNVSEVEMEDQLAGVKYLKSLDYIDGDRLAIHGWSYGGFMTTSLMLKHPDVFKVGVAGGPVTNWKYYEVMYTERYMDDPKSNPEGFEKTDLTKYVKNLKGDLLLIHGMSDDVVVPQHNLILVKSFVDAGVQVDFFPYIGHPHNVRGKDRVHLMEKVLNYIEDHIE